MTRPPLAAVSTECAYLVPWNFERGDSHYTLRNVGNENLSGVTFALYRGGYAPASAPVTLQSGDALELAISAGDLARDTIGIVRWFRPNGIEYLWRVSF